VYVFKELFSSSSSVLRGVGMCLFLMFADLKVISDFFRFFLLTNLFIKALITKIHKKSVITSLIREHSYTLEIIRF